MKIIQADPWHRAMSKEEVREFLSRPLILRIGLIDRDGYPMVHPVWFLYDKEFIISSHKDSKKVRLLKDNPKVYFIVDIEKPTGVRGKGDAEFVNDDTRKIMKDMLIKYGIALDSNTATQLLEEAEEAVVIKIKPKFLATWIYE